MSTEPRPPPGDRPATVLSCYTCKSRKLRCDRTLPTCARCIKSGDTCEYPAGRKRPVVTVTRPRMHELETRLRELEGKLSSERSSGSASSSPESTGLIDLGRFEQLPPRSLVEDLSMLYFSKLQFDCPMIHPAKYFTSLSLPNPQVQPPVCLQYTILAIAASASPDHKHLSGAFYKRARQYIEADEMRRDGDQVTLAHAQSWVLLSHYEAQNLWFSRASTSTARAVRVAQLLNLHQVDGKSPFGPTLAPPKDWLEREERRRTFWTIFCTDRYTSSTGGWPVLMNIRNIQTRLPVSTTAYLGGVEEPSLTFREVLAGQTMNASSFGLRIVTAYLFNECFEYSLDNNSDSEDVDEEYLFSHIQHLNTSVTNTLFSLPTHLQCPDNIHDNDAIIVNLLLNTALICIYRVAMARPHIVMAAAPDIQDKGLPAAQTIVTIIAIVGDIDTRFRNPLVAFAAYVAASFFFDDFVANHDPQSEEKLMALLNLMIAVGKQNTFTASLAVQLAQALKTSGVDPDAVEKARMAMGELDLNAPVPGQQHETNGHLLLCPLAGRPGHPPA